MSEEPPNYIPGKPTPIRSVEDNSVLGHFCVQDMIMRFQQEQYQERVINDAVAQGLAYARFGETLVDSPIERSILVNLIFGRYPKQFGKWPKPVFDPAGDDVPSPSSILIVPQLSFGRYRLDFGLIAKAKGHSVLIAVECDGREFHDAKRDQKRDAYFAGMSVPTIRLTGSEIYADSLGAAMKVFWLLEDWVESL